MILGVSAEQEELRASVRRFLADRAPIATVRELMETTDGLDAAVWKQAGTPPATAVRRELITPGGGIRRGRGPPTAGRTGPPITWRTVRTLTPWPACRASQLSTLVSPGTVTPSAQVCAQTSWMVNIIQPPPWR